MSRASTSRRSAAAERADEAFAAGTDLGPYQGIPIGIKDILATGDGPTTANSLILDPAWGEGKDGPVVTRLRAAGAVITGKLVTMEFAIGVADATKPFPIPRNPWNLDHWPGGSSSGTGNGVAAGLFFAGIGTDTGGSIRIPAAFCGTSGLMPTFGRVPKSGCAPLGYSLDHIGPLARSARDCAEFLQLIAGYHPSDESCVDRPVDDYVTGLDRRPHRHAHRRRAGQPLPRAGRPRCRGGVRGGGRGARRSGRRARRGRAAVLRRDDGGPDAHDDG